MKCFLVLNTVEAGLLFVTAVALWITRHRRNLNTDEVVVVVGLAFAAVHFLLFPSGFARHYFLAIALSLVFWIRWFEDRVSRDGP